MTEAVVCGYLEPRLDLDSTAHLAKNELVSWTLVLLECDITNRRFQLYKINENLPIILSFSCLSESRSSGPVLFFLHKTHLTLFP